METIFLSYRRDDSAGFAGRLAGDLEDALGDGAVFRDVDDLRAGEDFAQAIKRKLGTVKVVLVMIGPHWAGESDDGTRRIDDPQDFVRLEIKTALGSGRPVVPILVGAAAMPAAKDLPDDLQALVRLQAVELSDARWRHDLDRLLTDLKLSKPARPSSGSAWRAKLKRPLALSAAVAVAVVAMAIYFLQSTGPMDIDGIWRMPRDGHWAITQSGGQLDVAVFVSGRPHAWMRGSGHVSEGKIRITLLPNYDNPHHHRFACELALDRTGRRLVGTMRELTRGGQTHIDLERP